MRTLKFQISLAPQVINATGLYIFRGS